MHNLGGSNKHVEGAGSKQFSACHQSVTFWNPTFGILYHADRNLSNINFTSGTECAKMWVPRIIFAACRFLFFGLLELQIHFLFCFLCFCYENFLLDLSSGVWINGFWLLLGYLLRMKKILKHAEDGVWPQWESVRITLRRFRSPPTYVPICRLWVRTGPGYNMAIRAI